MSGLRLDWCSYAAAKFAVARWHYSRSLPAGKTVKVGVWEDGRFIGAVVFAYGANQYHGRQFGLTMQQTCELTRVALDSHKAPVSRILAIAVSMLRRHCPGLQLIVSYADIDQGHHGGIYCAAGWTYVGQVETGSQATPMFVVHGVRRHGRSIHSRGWVQRIDWLREHVDPKATVYRPTGKHKYFLALDRAVAAQLAAMTRPYPKRVKGLDSGLHPEEGGSTPTRTLQT
jgi:hypothetical protein